MGKKGTSVMNEYVIINANNIGFDRLVLCLTFESLLTYINKIENMLTKGGVEGRILIDQLLITGDSSNRFLSCAFSKGKLDFETAQIVEPAEYLKKESVKWLHDNYLYVENSILTAEQRQMIKDNKVF